jgi:O-antigen/teichoic acid export membrane protein
MITRLGLPQAMSRFLTASKDKQNIQEEFYSFAFVVFVAALVVSLDCCLWLPI